MDPPLATQGVGLGGGNSPSSPAGGERFDICEIKVYEQEINELDNLHVRAIRNVQNSLFDDC